MTGKQMQQHPMVPVPEAIRIVLKETARAVVQREWRKEKFTDTISLENRDISELCGAVLAEDVKMKQPGYPPYNASIMDGYAIRSTEFSKPTHLDWTHQVLDRVYAGDEQVPKTAEETSSSIPSAYYITTGAVVPDTYDCVVPVEEITVSEDRQNIKIHDGAKIGVGEWIRPIGCDILQDSVVLPKGHVIDPIALGLLKQAGMENITIRRPLKIGVLSTGNELLMGPKDDASKPGKIPDVNRPILLNLLASFGAYCKPVDLGNERDNDVEAMAGTVERSLESCDVIITTGGISMGETDIVEKVLVDHCGGKLHFGRMHMKPGKPTTFVTMHKGDDIRLVFAMPGNPVSAIVCTQLLVQPCLDLLYHGSSVNFGGSELNYGTDEYLTQVVESAFVHREIPAMLTHDIKLDQQRPEYHRVVVERLADGSFGVKSTGNQRSSRLVSCRDADALVALPVGSPSKPNASKGEFYPVLLLDNVRRFDALELKDSKHLMRRGREFKIAVVEVVPQDKTHLSKLEETSERVKGALSGEKSGAALIVSKKSFNRSVDELYSEAIDCNGADVVVVCCASFDGSFSHHLDVAKTLSTRLKKPAKSLALQARKGAAAENPIAALFEVVAGYAPEGDGAIVICLPDTGVSGGLGNVRGLLKHSLNVARGKLHNDHHNHSHDHSSAT